MSQLLVRPVEHSDVARCIDIRIECLGSLVIGKLPLFRGYREEQKASLHHDIDHKPHVHNWLVVDVKSGEIVAYANWVMYQGGRSNVKEAGKPAIKTLKIVDEHWRLRQAAHDYFQILSKLATTANHRRRGAASLLIQHCLKGADASELPCYLEGSEEGKRLYEKHGFKEVSAKEFDLAEYGLHGVCKLTEMVRESTKPVGMETTRAGFTASS
ncbi:acyl-CoA N-acyltransferase [Ophiobolus disseminans]|uniref:Acyl-CoA N-acyltransferase n=1 Tax=Ophiobolus disseminans TaxID=1469910 RepID=A0A6A7ACV1_9PLEO|nr:acyl-CoA N-acyltransferase [Ophiobolus disseminans]